MAKKVTITLDEDILAFIDKRGANNGETPNRSAYINDVLSQHRRTVLEAEMIAALQEDANDPEYQEEIALWDCVAGDGIEYSGSRLSEVHKNLTTPDASTEGTSATHWLPFPSP